MTNRRFIKPAKGVTVPDPAAGTALPEEGRQVEWSSYWERRLLAGDVAEAPEPIETEGSADEPIKDAGGTHGQAGAAQSSGAAKKGEKK